MRRRPPSSASPERSATTRRSHARPSHLAVRLLRGDKRAAHERLTQLLHLVDVGDLLSSASSRRQRALWTPAAQQNTSLSPESSSTQIAVSHMHGVPVQWAQGRPCRPALNSWEGYILALACMQMIRLGHCAAVAVHPASRNFSEGIAYTKCKVLIVLAHYREPLIKATMFTRRVWSVTWKVFVESLNVLDLTQINASPVGETT